MLKRQDFRFEVCANGVESCMAAQEGGADRVELCAGMSEGGTTPSFGEMKVARRVLTTTRLNVMIRPRGGDFVYTSLEIERMEDDIDAARLLGVDGVVLGCLTPEGNVDTAANARLLARAVGMDTTFHRAFDRCVHPMRALEEIIALGFGRILTSGQQPTAVEGTDLLRRLNEAAAGRIAIMAGCGVNEDNIRRIYTTTGVSEYHFSARIELKSNATLMNNAVKMGEKDVDEAVRMITSARRVAVTIMSICK